VARPSRLDSLGLREIVELTFIVVPATLAIVPLAVELGFADAVRVASAGALGYGVATAIVLTRRMRLSNIRWTSRLRLTVGVLDAGVLVAGPVALIGGSIIAYQVVLIALLVRPTLAYVFALAALGR